MQGLARFGGGLLVLSNHPVVISKVYVWDLVAGIALYPKLILLVALLNLPGEINIVLGRDIVLFPFAHPLSQLIGFLNIPDCKIRLIEIPIPDRQRSVGPSKIRIEFNGLPKKRKRSSIAFLVRHPLRLAKGLQSFKGWRSSLLQRLVELLD